MKKLFLLAIVGAIACVSANAQNYNFNVGGLQYSSGAAVPGSCPREGSWFFKNTATTGWYQCSGGVYVASGGGSGTVTNTGILKSGLLAEYTMTECTGTSIADSSGNANDGTFGAQAPTWLNGAGCATSTPYSGLQFAGASSQFVTLPAALNSARTIFLVTEFNPTPSTTTYQSPISGNSVPGTTWGALFSNLSAGLLGGNAYPFSGGGQYAAEGWSSSIKIGTMQSAGGINIFTWSLGSAGDSTHDAIWVNNNVVPFAAVFPPLQANIGPTATGQSAGLQSAGNYQLGGSASGKLLASFSTFYTGDIYYAAFYSTYLTGAQIAQNTQAIAALMAQRGVSLDRLNSIAGVFNQAVLAGDSITWGTGLTTNYAQYMTLNSQGAWQWVDVGMPSITAQQYAAENTAQLPDSWFSGNGNQVEVMWLGTNDCAGGATGAQAYAYLDLAARQHKRHMTGPSKFLVASMLSRTGQDTCKNALNGPMRQSWATFADGLIDMAADPNIGADGASATATYFQGDAIHPTTHAQANDIAPLVQRAVNRLYGNNSWTNATTYTTAASAAAATTAGSESTNTITVTFSATPANCQVGNQIVIAGTTPAGYSGTWQILTRSATQVTYWNNTTGLGAISVQGTGACPQQQDADVYTILGGSAAGNPSFTLESCVGYTGQNLYFKNTNTTSAWVLTPFTASETIDGATSLTMPTALSGNNPVVILQSTLVSAAAGGCTWKRLQ